MDKTSAMAAMTAIAISLSPLVAHAQTGGGAGGGGAASGPSAGGWIAACRIGGRGRRPRCASGPAVQVCG